MHSSKNLPIMPALCSKLAYYAGIMLDALACLLCLKLCRHNRRMLNAMLFSRNKNATEAIINVSINQEWLGYIRPCMHSKIKTKW